MRREDNSKKKKKGLGLEVLDEGKKPRSQKKSQITHEHQGPPELSSGLR